MMIQPLVPFAVVGLCTFQSAVTWYILVVIFWHRSANVLGTVHDLMYWESMPSCNTQSSSYPWCPFCVNKAMCFTCISSVLVMCTCVPATKLGFQSHHQSWKMVHYPIKNDSCTSYAMCSPDMHQRVCLTGRAYQRRAWGQAVLLLRGLLFPC